MNKKTKKIVDKREPEVYYTTVQNAWNDLEGKGVLFGFQLSKFKPGEKVKVTVELRKAKR